jgi:hypothetical protein
MTLSRAKREASDERARQLALAREQDEKARELVLDIRAIFSDRLDYGMHDARLTLACVEVVKMLRDRGVEI